MSNLKEIRTRISSIQSTKKITSAMKMVAAAKLKKAQNAVINLRPYANKLYNLLMDVAQSMEPGSISSPYLRTQGKEKGNILLVVITSNKGLCGAFNANIVKKTDQLINTKYSRQNKEGKVFIHSIGKKSTDHFKKSGYKMIGSDDDLLEQTSYSKVLPVINKVLESFREKDYDKIEIVYNKFKNAAVQILTVEKFLPLDLKLNEQKEMDIDTYIFEPNKHYIVQNLIPKLLRIQFFEAILESLAAEHGARMTAMHKATDNATDMIRDLQLKYNKARQAAITKEISEVVSGAEALSK